MNRKIQPQHKPRYIAYVASSIDGKISLLNNKAPTWTSKEDWRFFQKSLSKMDAVVVGRNTYESASARLKKRNTFVLTSRVKKTEKKGSITFVNTGRVDISDVLEEYEKVAVLGGGMVYRYMLESGLLDEIYVTIEPLIFGRGKEMFAGNSKTTKAHLLSVKKLNSSGTLLLHYRIKK